MKILVVHNTYQQPGGEDVVFEQELQLLQRMGHQVTTYVRSNWEIETYSPLQRLGLVAKIVWATDTRKEFIELLRQERPDVVHVHNTFVMISPSIYSACGEAGVPVVQTLHNYRLICPGATLFRNGHVCEECIQHTLLRSVRYGCYRGSRAGTALTAVMLATHRQLQTMTKNVDCFIALTQFSRNKFIEGGLPAEKIAVKPNFVYPDPCSRTSDGDRALFVGRLSPEKRVSTLLDAWKLLCSPIPLDIIGGGPQQSELLSLASLLKLPGVQFKGTLPRAQTLAAMSEARFLVFCSEWYENFPCTIAEAFACRTPVICSRMGAMAEIVEDGRTGLHFTTGDAADLASKVEWAWSHPKQMREMGEEARKEYETKYTAEKNYPILMDIYERAISGNSDVQHAPNPALVGRDASGTFAASGYLQKQTLDKL